MKLVEFRLTYAHHLDGIHINPASVAAVAQEYGRRREVLGQEVSLIYLHSFTTPFRVYGSAEEVLAKLAKDSK